MAVYVDELLPCVKNANWHYDTSCHLVADSDEELSDFAAKIGLMRLWIQPDAAKRKTGSIPHFDLTKGMRAKAVAFGAEEIDRYVLVALMRKYRSQTNEVPV